MPDSSLAERPSAPLRGVPRRGWTGHLAKFLLLSVTLYFTIRFAQNLQWRELQIRLAAARPSLVLLAIGCLVFRFASVAIRWSLALSEFGGSKAGGSIGPFRRRFFILLASVFLNHVTPSARILGGMLRARYQARFQQKEFSTIYGTVLFDQVVQQGLTTLMTILSGLAFFWATGEIRWFYLGIAILVLLAAGTTVWIRLRGNRSSHPSLARIIQQKAQSQSRRLKGLVLGTSGAVRTFTYLLAQRPLRIKMPLMALAYVALTFAAQLLVFVALDHDVSALIVFVALSLGTALGALSGSPGGIATTEAAMVGTYVLLGVNQIDAAAATFLFRGLHYALVLIMGLPSLIYFELQHRS